MTYHNRLKIFGDKKGDKIMRNPDRLDEFYDRLKKVHKEKYPDLRFGQFMMCVLGDMMSYGRDPFFPEEDEMIKFIEEWR